MEFLYPKRFAFLTDREITAAIAESPDFSGCEVFWFDTGFSPEDTVQPGRYLRPPGDFEAKLEQKVPGYFAYIKFFRYQGERYGIVAGKTGSRAVNAKGSDVSFSLAPDARRWNAKEFLLLQTDCGFAWAMEQILIVTAKAPAAGRKANEKQALEIEKKLIQEFHIMES